MTSGTSNVVRIFGSTYADYGVQPDGPDRDVFAEAPCVGRWAMFDGDNGPAAMCAECPALEMCRERARGADAQYGYHGFWAGLTPDERKLEDVEAGGPSSRDVQRAARVEKIRKLAGQGLTDVVIGERLSLGTRSVQAIRTSAGISPGGDGRGGARGRQKIQRERT